jgi:hypothetical protein
MLARPFGPRRKMSPKIDRIQKMIKLGKTKYTIYYGVLLWGVPVGLMYGFIFPIIEHRNLELLNLIIGLVLFPLLGIVFGLVSWKCLLYKIDSLKNKNNRI